MSEYRHNIRGIADSAAGTKEFKNDLTGQYDRANQISATLWGGAFPIGMASSAATIATAGTMAARGLKVAKSTDLDRAAQMFRNRGRFEKAFDATGNWLLNGMPLSPLKGMVAGGVGFAAADYALLHSSAGFFGDTYKKQEDIVERQMTQMEDLISDRTAFPRAPERATKEYRGWLGGWVKEDIAFDGGFNELAPSDQDWNREESMPQYRVQANMELNYHRNRDEIDEITPEGRHWWQNADVYAAWQSQKDWFNQQGINPTDPQFMKQMYSAANYDPDAPLQLIPHRRQRGQGRVASR